MGRDGQIFRCYRQSPKYVVAVLHDIFYGQFYTIICVVQSARTRVRRRVLRRLIWTVAACHPPCRDIFRIEWNIMLLKRKVDTCNILTNMLYLYNPLLSLSRSLSLSIYIYISLLMVFQGFLSLRNPFIIYRVTTSSTCFFHQWQIQWFVL